jgi:hypothetical protein
MHQHFDILWTRMKTQKSKRWQDGTLKLPYACLEEYSVHSDIAAGSASFDEQTSLMSVFSEECKLLGSKVVPPPEIGSEFDFEDMLVTVEGVRSALEDVTNRVLLPPPSSYNSSKIHKNVQQLSSQQDASLAAASALESLCDAKFLVAFTRYVCIEHATSIIYMLTKITISLCADKKIRKTSAGLMAQQLIMQHLGSFRCSLKISITLVAPL